MKHRKSKKKKQCTGDGNGYVLRGGVCVFMCVRMVLLILTAKKLYCYFFRIVKAYVSLYGTGIGPFCRQRFNMELWEGIVCERDMIVIT